MGIRRMGMGIKTWEWEKITAYCNYSKLCDSREFMGSERKSVLRKLYTVARQVLCSAASERVFITTGRLLERRRLLVTGNCEQSSVLTYSNMD